MQHLFLTLCLTLSLGTIFGQTCHGDQILVSQNDVNAFGPCAMISGDLVIGGAGSNISDLTRLNTVLAISGDLIIENADLLTILNGFPRLTTIGGALRISSNDELSSLGGFYSLQFVGDRFEVTSNPVLVDFGCFSDLGLVEGDLVIENNSNMLQDCFGLCTLIQNEGIMGSISISGNGTECTLSELQNLCPTQSACGPPACAGTDLNNDGVVNAQDFLILLQDYAQICTPID